MTVIQIGDYKLKCEACGVLRIDVEFDLHMVYLWSNQYGTKIRLFCHRCGAVHDVTIKYGVKPVVERHSMSAAIFRSEVK